MGTEQDLREQVASLAARVRALEDRLELQQLAASYGPSADSGVHDDVCRLWLEDGTYEHTTFELVGHDGLLGMLEGEQHQRNIMGGSAHVISSPSIAIDGDRAVLTCHSVLYVRDGDGWRVRWASANRWECRRTADGWKVERRINRPLDGSAEARALFAARTATPLDPWTPPADT